ncbi:MAG: polysaccharide pyruvyl transferase family protein [Flavobacteriaceae bacterium]
MKKALIINEGYSDNFGDQAIKESMISIFGDHGYETDFLYLTKPTIQNLPHYKYSAAAIKSGPNTSVLKGLLYFFYWFYVNRKPIVSKIREKHYDTVVFGGGQLVNTSGRMFPSAFATSLYWITLLIAKNSKAKMYLVAVGCASKFGTIEEYLYKKAIKKIEAVWVRDHFSEKAMVKMFKRKATIIPDIAFYQSSKKPFAQNEKKQMALVGVTNFKEVFLKYNKKSDLTQEDYYEIYYKKIQEYAQKKLVPKLFYTTITDAVECNSFQQWLHEKHQERIDIFHTNTLEGLVHELYMASVVFSARMHALILGMKCHCTVEPYLISEKLKSFNDDYLKSHRTIPTLSNEIVQALKPLLNNE